MISGETAVVVMGMLKAVGIALLAVVVCLIAWVDAVSYGGWFWWVYAAASIPLAVLSVIIVAAKASERRSRRV